MKLNNLILLFAAVCLAGCVTTTSGDMRDLASKEEAARLNMDLGIGYLRQGDFEEAMVKLEKSIQEQPQNPPAHRALGIVYERLGDNVGAEKQYRIAVKQAPDDADNLNQLAVFLCVYGDRKEAVKLFDQAVRVPLYQNRFMLYTNAAKCVKSTDLVMAEGYLRRALGINSQYPDALFQMADVAYLQERYLQSRAFIERYMVVAQPTPVALWLAYRVEVAQQDIAGAKKFADQLLKQYPESKEAGLLLEQQRNAG